MMKWEKEFNEVKGLVPKGLVAEHAKLEKLIDVIEKLEKEYSDKSQGEGEGTGT